MGALFDTAGRVFAVIGLQLIYTIFCMVYRPYKAVYNTVLHLLNELTVLWILVVVAVYEYFPNQHQQTAWMII